MQLGRHWKCATFVAMSAAWLVSLAGAACVPAEQTTPLGYVIAPSSPPSDGGLDASDAAPDR